MASNSDTETPQNREEIWNAFTNALVECVPPNVNISEIWPDTNHQQYRRRIINAEGRTLENLRKVVEGLGVDFRSKIRFVQSMKSSSLFSTLKWQYLMESFKHAKEIEDLVPAPVRISPESLKMVISYGSRDRQWALDLQNRFAGRRCKAQLLEQGLEIKTTRDKMHEMIEEADCLLVLLSPEIFNEEGWTRRHVDKALSIQESRQGQANRHPLILAASHLSRLDEINGLKNLALDLAGFDCGTPRNRSHNFNDYEHLVFHPKNPDEMIQSTRELFNLEVSHIKSLQDRSLDNDLFEGAMSAYEQLIPDECERDPEEFIARWIDSNNEDDLGADQERKNWIDWLTVMHRDRSVYGAFWANVDKRKGLGAVTFWGMKAGKRNNGLSALLVRESLMGIEDYISMFPNTSGMTALFFDVEPIDLAFFDGLVNGAVEMWKNFHTRKLSSEELVKTVRSEIHPETGRSFLLTYLEDYTNSEDNLAVLAENVRRYRRIQFYASFAGRTPEFRKSGWSVKAFVVSGNDEVESDSIFAPYMQPPIIPPTEGGLVRDEDSRQFYMFAIVSETAKITGKEALTWQYDSFLADQYSPGKLNELAGWSNYMVDFKKKNLLGLDAARLKDPRLGKKYVSARVISNLVKLISRNGGADPLSQIDITL